MRGLLRGAGEGDMEDKPERRQGNIEFLLMGLEFCIRDWFRPPMRILREAGVHSGMTLLDFGCGPGGFSLSAARLIGPDGLVYAVDCHPLALQLLRRRMKKQGVTNIRLLFREEMAEIPQENVDMALLYDVLHDLPEPHAVLTDLERALKPHGVLSIRDHHLKEAPLQSIMTRGGLFRFAGTDGSTFRFVKAGTRETVS